MSELRELLELIDDKGQLTKKEAEKYSKVIQTALSNDFIDDEGDFRYRLCERGYFYLLQCRANSAFGKIKKSTLKMERLQQKANKVSNEMKKYTWRLMVFTIIMIIFGGATIVTSVIIYFTERNMELENHINSLGALEYELKMDLDLIDNGITTMEEFFLNKSSLMMFAEFFHENLEKITSDGRMDDDILRSHIISTLFKIYEINNGLYAVLYNIELAQNETKRLNIERQLFQEMKETLREKMADTKCFVGWRIDCLISKRDYSQCKLPEAAEIDCK